MAIWNAGALTLDGALVVPNYPLRLKFRGSVLSVSILARTHAENNFDAWPDTEVTNSVQLKFDYLDHDHGALIDVVHASNRWGGNPSGTLKGIVTAISEREPLFDLNIVSLLPIVGMSAAGIGSLVSARGVSDLIFSAVILFFAFLLALNAFISIWRATPPKSLRVSEKSTTLWRRALGLHS